MSSPTTEKTTMFLFPDPSCLEGDRLEQAMGALALGLLMRTFTNEHSGGWDPVDCVIQMIEHQGDEIVGMVKSGILVCQRKQYIEMVQLGSRLYYRLKKKCLNINTVRIPYVYKYENNIT